MLPLLTMNDEDTMDAWAKAFNGYDQGSKCECGTNKVFKGAANLEYLHSHWCPLYLSPNWLNELNKENKDGKK